MGAFRKRRLITASILVIIVALPVAWYLLSQQNNSNNTGIEGKSASENLLASKDPNVYAELQRQSLDTRVANSTAFLDSASKDFLDWRVYGDASVINPGQGTYRQEPMTPQTIQLFSNYSLALQTGLPRHSVADIHVLGNMTQNDADTFNCNPIRLGDNSSYVDIVPVPHRLAWDLVQQVKQIKEGGFAVENQKGIGLALNTKAITNEWCIFDNPSGIAYCSREPGMSINDSRVSELTNLQWKLFSQFAPISGSKTYNDFPWWDSQKLRTNNPDENGLRAQLFNLWYLHPYTFSIKDQKDVDGIEGAKTDLLQSAEQFRAIRSMYPNGMLQTEYMGPKDPRFFCYAEMDDRFHHGASNTISAFVGGWDDAKVGHVIGVDNNYDWIHSQNGPEQFLTRNWPSYDLAKFIIGYERWNPKVPEISEIEYVTPSVLRMAGFPVNHIVISPNLGDGCSLRQSAVGMPQNVAQSLRANFPNVLLGPGYTVSIYSCADGLRKDGVKEAFVPFGEAKVYLMK